MTRELRIWALELAVKHGNDCDPVPTASRFLEFVLKDERRTEKRRAWDKELIQQMVAMSDAGESVKTIQTAVADVTGVIPTSGAVRTQISLARKATREAQS